MSDNNALVSRQASPSSAPVQMQSRDDVLMARAKHVAKQGDMIPTRYRNNVGACMMAIDWAERNNVAWIDALGHVAFVYGKPVIEARLQKRMARERGYSTRLLETTDDHATVAVYGADGNQIGEPVTYTWQMAQDYGIHLENKKTGKWKDSWKADRAHMLVLRATTRALDYYGDGTFGDPDENTLDIPTAADSDSEAVDVEVVADTADDTPDSNSEPMAPSEDELRALAKQHKLTLTQVLKEAQIRYPEAGLTTMEALAGNPTTAADLAQWMTEQ